LHHTVYYQVGHDGTFAEISGMENRQCRGGKTCPTNGSCIATRLVLFVPLRRS
jgi:hypothetical protein